MVIEKVYRLKNKLPAKLSNISKIYHNCKQQRAKPKNQSKLSHKKSCYLKNFNDKTISNLEKNRFKIKIMLTLTLKNKNKFFHKF